MKVALTAGTETGGVLSDHFGKAPYFQVYEVTGGEARYIETRSTEPMEKPGCNHRSAKDLMGDVDVVITSVMGRGAYNQLTKMGKTVYVVEAMGVDEALKRFLDNTMVHDPERIKKKAASHGKFINLG